MMAYAALLDGAMAVWESAWSVSVFACKYLLLMFLAISIFRRLSNRSFKGFKGWSRTLSAIGKDFKQLLMCYGFESAVSVFAAGFILAITDMNPYFASLPFLLVLLPSLLLKGLPEVEKRIYSFKYVLLSLFIMTLTLGAFVTGWLLPSLAALAFYGLIFWEL